MEIGCTAALPRFLGKCAINVLYYHDACCLLRNVSPLFLAFDEKRKNFNQKICSEAGFVLLFLLNLTELNVHEVPPLRFSLTHYHLPPKRRVRGTIKFEIKINLLYDWARASQINRQSDANECDKVNIVDSDILHHVILLEIC